MASRKNILPSSGQSSLRKSKSAHPVRQADDVKAANRVSKADALLARIVETYPTLSPQYQRIARDIEMRPLTIALDGISQVANRCSVHPSSVVRFAKHFGFSGFTDLRMVFRTELRARDGNLPRPDVLANANWKAFLSPRIEDTRAALSAWRETIVVEAIDGAARSLAAARTIAVICTAKALPLAYYFVYCLQKLGKFVEIVSLGSPLLSTGNLIGKSDCCLTIKLGEDRACRALERLARKQNKCMARILITEASAHEQRSDCIVLTVAPASGIDLDSIASATDLCEYILFSVRMILRNTPETRDIPQINALDPNNYIGRQRSLGSPLIHCRSQ